MVGPAVHGGYSGLVAVALACFVIAAPALAASYSESADGEISGNRLAPTRLLLGFAAGANVAGSNVVSGSTGRANGVVDRDYLHVVVQPGFLWAELRVGNQTAVGGGGSFIGIASGAFMSVAPEASSAAGLLGYRVYGTADRNTDILAAMGLSSNGASGFAAPLPAGDYTVWIQELATGTFGYRFNFVISPVPEPSMALLWALGLAVLAGGRLKVIRQDRCARGVRLQPVQEGSTWVPSSHGRVEWVMRHPPGLRMPKEISKSSAARSPASPPGRSSSPSAGGRAAARGRRRMK